MHVEEKGTEFTYQPHRSGGISSRPNLSMTSRGAVRVPSVNAKVSMPPLAMQNKIDSTIVTAAVGHFTSCAAHDRAITEYRLFGLLLWHISAVQGTLGDPGAAMLALMEQIRESNKKLGFVDQGHACVGQQSGPSDGKKTEILRDIGEALAYCGGEELR